MNQSQTGVHVDQFLHAYYYLRVRDGNRQPFDAYFDKYRNDPESALKEQMRWWKDGDYVHESEARFIHEWAPSSGELLSKGRVTRLSEDEFVKLCGQIHAMRDHAIKLESQFIGLPLGSHIADAKIKAFGRWLYRQRSSGNKTPLDTINYVLYEGNQSQTPNRLWNATHSSDWKIEHFGLSSLGEIVGWARPDIFPPRNARTSKALRALGNDVRIY